MNRKERKEAEDIVDQAEYNDAVAEALRESYENPNVTRDRDDNKKNNI